MDRYDCLHGKTIISLFGHLNVSSCHTEDCYTVLVFLKSSLNWCQGQNTSIMLLQVQVSRHLWYFLRCIFLRLPGLARYDVCRTISTWRLGAKIQANVIDCIKTDTLASLQFGSVALFRQVFMRTSSTTIFWRGKVMTGFSCLRNPQERKCQDRQLPSWLVLMHLLALSF